MPIKFKPNLAIKKILKIIIQLEQIKMTRTQTKIDK